MSRYALTILFSAVYLFITCPVLARHSKKYQQGFGVEVNTMTGRIIKHSVKFTSPIPRMSNALDVNLSWRSYGKKDWQQRRRFPTTGVGLTYTDYGNNRIYGRCVGLYGCLQFPLIRRDKVEWTLRFGDGLGYVTRKYQATYPVDTQNCAIGSNLNDFAILMTDVRIHTDEHWQFQVGANFTHISNACYHQPNLGVNMVGMHFGVQYYPVTFRPKAIQKDLPRLSNRWLAEFRYSMAYKEARSNGSPILPSYNIAGFASRRWHSKNKFYVGMDYAWHEDVYAFLKQYGIYVDKHQRSFAWDGTVFAGNEFLVGRFGIVGQLGVYYHQTFLKFDDYCEKIGTNFYLVSHEHGPVKEAFLTALVLTHGVVAQYGEFGVGVGF